jgi:hypothetical protein
MNYNAKDSVHGFLNSDISFHENSSVGSIKYYLNNRSALNDKLKKNNVTLPLEKPRERSRRLYNRRDDIYLPDISKNNPSKKGKSMFDL